MSFPYRTGPRVWSFSCWNCQRPLEWLEGVGWLHSGTPHPVMLTSCDDAQPGCDRMACDHTDGPRPTCSCQCHNRVRGG